MRIQREGQGGSGSTHPQIKIHKNIGFICITGPDPLKNHIATKHLMLAHYLPVSETQMAFRWRADDGSVLVEPGSSLRSSKTKNNKKHQSWVGLPLTKLSGFAHAHNNFTQHFCGIWTATVAFQMLKSYVLFDWIDPENNCHINS